MEKTQQEYTRELEKLITEVLLPGYLQLAQKHHEPFPWAAVPAHLAVAVKAPPKKLAKLLQKAAFRV